MSKDSRKKPKKKKELTYKQTMKKIAKLEKEREKLRRQTTYYGEEAKVLGRIFDKMQRIEAEIKELKASLRHHRQL